MLASLGTPKEYRRIAHNSKGVVEEVNHCKSRLLIFVAHLVTTVEPLDSPPQLDEPVDGPY
jgi:hypothetical protein